MSPENAARINAVAKTIRGEPSRMRARGVLFTSQLGLAPASSNFLMSGMGSVVTTQGKFGAVSMFRRSTAQNKGVNLCASALLTSARWSIRNEATSYEPLNIAKPKVSLPSPPTALTCAPA